MHLIELKSDYSLGLYIMEFGFVVDGVLGKCNDTSYIDELKH